jgi:hypothetical protein
MAHCSTLMGQLLQLIPRHVFDHLVDTHAWQAGTGTFNQTGGSLSCGIWEAVGASIT